jgi:hypothetical protein
MGSRQREDLIVNSALRLDGLLERWFDMTSRPREIEVMK